MDTDSDPRDRDLDERPLDPGAMASLMQAERAAVSRHDLRASAVIVAAWGGVWLLGYLTLWSGDGFGGNPWFRLGGALPWWIVGVMTAIGIVVSTIAGVSMGRGRRGPSNRAGAMIGVSFGIGSVAVGLIDVGMLRAGLTGEQMSLLLPASFTLLIGALYMAAAGLTRSWSQYVAGVVLLAVVILATFVGPPHHLLVYAAAGFVFLVSAWALWTGRVDA